MKAVLISIHPQWCERIALCNKTLEVRKTRPKVEIPFRCYIYQTKKKWLYKLLAPLKHFAWVETVILGRGKVIGEYICDAIVPISVKYSDVNSRVALREFPFTCLTDKQIIDYLGNGVTGYGWHISNLKIYEKPKKLRDFYTLKKCNSCRKSGYESTACIFDEDCIVPAVITRPPQSWCYVEELVNR